MLLTGLGFEVALYLGHTRRAGHSRDMKLDSLAEWRATPFSSLGSCHRTLHWRRRRRFL